MLNDFFERIIEGYLIRDLENMDKISVEGAGNCGYPMLLTIFSGAELLGGLSYNLDTWGTDSNKQKNILNIFLKNL